jgi:hypothetical protein
MLEQIRFQTYDFLSPGTGSPRLMIFVSPSSPKSLTGSGGGDYPGLNCRSGASPLP